MTSRIGVLLLLTVSCVAFSGGITLPLFSVQPGAGEWTGTLRMLVPDKMAHEEVTLLSGIGLFWREQEYFLAGLLVAFSVVLPVLKLCVLWWETVCPSVIPKNLLAVFRALSHYAMVEVFIVALLVLLLKSLPGGSYITLEAGTYAFACSVLLSIVACRFVALPEAHDNLTIKSDTVE